jgi:hypothetical protein
MQLRAVGLKTIRLRYDCEETLPDALRLDGDPLRLHWYIPELQNSVNELNAPGGTHAWFSSVAPLMVREPDACSTNSRQFWTPRILRSTQAANRNHSPHHAAALSKKPSVAHGLGARCADDDMTRDVERAPDGLRVLRSRILRYRSAATALFGQTHFYGSWYCFIEVECLK